LVQLVIRGWPVFL